MSVFTSWFDRVSLLGDKEHFDEFERTSNVLINQIQLLICVWLGLFLIKDAIELNSDFWSTLIIHLLMVSLLIFRNKMNYLMASSFQIFVCILGASMEYYIHNCELRMESIYTVIALMAILLLPTKISKFIFVSLTFLSYFLVRYATENYKLLIQSDLASEDNILIFVFSILMVVIITPRYFQLIKKVLSDQNKLLEVLKSKNKELERFAYITSHDLKQPLRNIGSFAGLLRRTANDPDKAEKNLEYLEQIETSAGRMNKLIEEILSFSKIDKTEISKEAVNLNEVVEEFKSSHSEYLKEKKADIIYDTLPTIKGNKLYISLLFQNLIENGIKYNSSEIPTVKILSTIMDNKINLSIIDNGIGISKEYSAVIFEPFQRLHSKRKYEGTGLGLSICKKIVETHEGEISIEYKEGETGTNFRIILPIL